MNSWAGTWQVSFVSSNSNKKKILLDETLPGELILDVDPMAQQMKVESYVCKDVVNMPVYWKNCLFIKYGFELLTPPNQAGSPVVPYAAYDSASRSVIKQTYNTIANHGHSGIDTCTERLIAATQNNDPSAHVEYIFLYRIQNSVTPNANAGAQNKDFLIVDVHFWNTAGGGGGNPDGTGSGSKTRP